MITECVLEVLQSDNQPIHQSAEDISNSSKIEGAKERREEGSFLPVTTQEEQSPRSLPLGGQGLSGAAGDMDEDDKIPGDFCAVFFPTLHTFHSEPLLVCPIVSTSGAIRSEGCILRGCKFCILATVHINYWIILFNCLIV